MLSNNYIYDRLNSLGRGVKYAVYAMVAMEIIFVLCYLLMLFASNGAFGDGLQQYFTPQRILEWNDFAILETHHNAFPLLFFVFVIQNIAKLMMAVCLVQWVYKAYTNAQRLAERSGGSLWERKAPTSTLVIPTSNAARFHSSASHSTSQQPPEPVTMHAELLQRDPSEVDLDSLRPAARGRITTLPETQASTAAGSGLHTGERPRQLAMSSWSRSTWDNPYFAVFSFMIPLVNIIAPKPYLDRMLFGFADAEQEQARTEERSSAIDQEATGYEWRDMITSFLVFRAIRFFLPMPYQTFRVSDPPSNLDLSLVLAIVSRLADAIAALYWVYLITHTNNSQQEFEEREA